MNNEMDQGGDGARPGPYVGVVEVREPRIAQVGSMGVVRALPRRVAAPSAPGACWM